MGGVGSKLFLNWMEIESECILSDHWWNCCKKRSSSKMNVAQWITGLITDGIFKKQTFIEKVEMKLAELLPSSTLGKRSY